MDNDEEQRTLITDILESDDDVMLNQEHSSIVHKNAITSPNNELDDDRICPLAKLKYAQCSDCDSTFMINLDCHRKDCYVCQRKRSQRLYNQYYPMIQYWIPDDDMKIQFLTVTHISKMDISREWLESRDKHFINLKRRMINKGYVFDFGFVCKEATYHEIGEPKFDYFDGYFFEVGEYTELDAGYHYHQHILFYGKYIDLTDPEWNISSMWKDITQDSYMVKLYSRFNDGRHSLNYLLKYVTKVSMEESALSKFNFMTRKMRMFQTFGKKYSVRLSKKEQYYETQLADLGLQATEYEYLDEEKYYVFKNLNINDGKIYLFTKNEGKFQYVQSKKSKLPFRCSKCFGTFKSVDNGSFRSSLSDKIPNGVDELEVLVLNKLSLKFFVRNYLMKIKKGNENNSTLNQNFVVLNKVQQIMSKISIFLEQDSNCSMIENLVDDKDLQYLLEKGILYMPRYDTYKELK